MKSRILPILVLFLLAVARLAAAATEVDSIGITVSDMDRAVRFYSDVLGFEPVSTKEVAGEDYERLMGVFGLRVVITKMRLGDEYIELMQFLAPRGRPVPLDSRSNDLWFQHVAIVVSDIDRAYARLRQAGVQHASSGPQRLPDWNPNAGGIAAFYFRDPDDNHLEIIEFPAGKGDPKWRDNRGKLFLGIDHTAIVVDDTETSLRYYRDILGLRVAGASENYGPEQERLNNVFGARLRITALRGDQGPGVEFLEYLAPATGRPMPADTQANDLWHWQINVETSALHDIAARATAAGYSIVSGDVTPANGGEAVMIRDPDGHAALLSATPSNHEATAGRQRPESGVTTDYKLSGVKQ